MDNNNTILLAKIRDVLSTLFGTFTSDLDIIKAKLEGISDLIIRNDITTDTDTIDFNTDLIEKLCKCDISFSYIQAGSGTPAPDNVRTISGYDSLSVAVLESHDPDSYIVKEIEFDNTVYVGNIDIVNGSGESTHELIDMGDLNWTYTSGDHSRLTATLTGSKGAPSGQTFKGACSIYKPAPYNAIYNHTEDKIIGISDTGTVWVYDSDYTDADVFKSAVTGQKLCYELATPTAITITLESITTIEGDNIISTNRLHTSEDINTTGIEVCYFETVNNYFKNKEV